MFESVIGEARRPRRRFGPAIVTAVALHGAGVAVAAGLAAAPAEEPREVEVTFFQPAPRPPTPTGPSARPPTPTAARIPAPPPAPPPTAAPTAPPTPAPTAPPTPTPPAPTPTPDAGGGGEVGAPASLTPVLSPRDAVGEGGDARGAPAEFDGGQMSHPVRLGGPDPRYTPEALAREIEGTMTVKCVVTVEGAVRGCRVIRGLPFMDGAVVDALERRRYRPATLAGAPIEVDYLFRLTLRLP